MKTFYARVARGRSVSMPNGYGRSFAGFGVTQVLEGADRVDALIRLYSELATESTNISAIRPHGAARVLGFDDNEWDLVRSSGIELSEGLPEQLGTGIQIEAIRDKPF